MPVLFIAPHDIHTYKKVLGNIEEVKARGGIIMAIATEGDKEIPKKAKAYNIHTQNTLYTLSSILAAVPLQLLAYHIAEKLGKMWTSLEIWQRVLLLNENKTIQDEASVFCSLISNAFVAD